jgi:hypothetical protein
MTRQVRAWLFVASLVGSAGLSVVSANGCPPELPVLCECSYTQSNGFTITASRCCPDGNGCNCTTLKDENGVVIGISVRCVQPSPGPGGGGLG